ncbi:hypothetical protein JOC34_004431 [Virgibacillus halotolerans]|nr:hypothetical protein [Virgibacillus halotolerans]
MIDPFLFTQLYGLNRSPLDLGISRSISGARRSNPGKSFEHAFVVIKQVFLS